MGGHGISGAPSTASPSSASITTPQPPSRPIDPAKFSPEGADLVNITEERTAPGADPNYPRFTAHIRERHPTDDDYYNIVLPFLARKTFVLESSADINFFHTMLKSPNFPNAAYAIQRVSFPKMYWFSGIQNNRRMNPSLAFLASLPAVQEVSLVFHTAGLTTSAFAEKDRLRIEIQDLERSKSLKVIRMSDLVRHYGLGQLFACKTLKTVHLVCYNSEMVAFWVGAGDPLSSFRDLIHWIQQGFAQTHGTRVEVDARVVTPE